MSQPRDQVTQILACLGRGDAQAADELLPLVYGELRRLARSQLARERAGQTLEPTALVHEAYLRLVGVEDPGWSNRRHFFAAAAQAMRRILVEQARRKKRVRHGGGMQRVDGDPSDLPIRAPDEDVISVDEALRQLEADDPRKGLLVNLRFFAGLTAAQAAEVMGVSLATVEREWRYVRAWLYRRLHGESAPEAKG